MATRRRFCFELGSLWGLGATQGKFLLELGSFPLLAVTHLIFSSEFVPFKSLTPTQLKFHFEFAPKKTVCMVRQTVFLCNFFQSGFLNRFSARAHARRNSLVSFFSVTRPYLRRCSTAFRTPPTSTIMFIIWRSTMTNVKAPTVV